MSKYPQTMAALARVEGTVWGVVDALVAEVETTESGMAKRGQYEEISKEAAKQGFVNPSTGESYAAEYLGKLREVGLFANSDRATGVELRQYPVSRVGQAKKKAKADPKKALEILRTGETARVIEGRDAPGSTTPVVKTEEQARSIVRAASPAARQAMFAEALVDPDVARAAARDEQVQETLVHARLDDAYQRQTGRSIRPLPTQRDEGPDEGLLRPGLAFLAIGTALHKSRLAIVDAIGHVSGSDITPELRAVLRGLVESQKALLVDLELAIDGHREITDDDITAWLQQATEDYEGLKEVS